MAGAPHDELEARLRTELEPELHVSKLLASSATAAVFLAREPALGRTVALKVLGAPARPGEVERARFEREARAAASLAHPNVVTVHRYGRLSDGTPYLVLQYVKGRSLSERLAAEGPLPGDEARRVLADVAAALAAAHGHNIVHRNVRPSKVLCDQETGRALLTDFGIVAILDEHGRAGQRLTRTGEIVGDPHHISPEALDGREPAPAADVYSLGVLGYELLTGEGPYGNLPAGALVAAHMNESPRPLSSLRPDVDPVLADVLTRCLAKKPEHRPDAAFVARALGGPSEKSAAVTPVPSPWLGGTVERLLRRRLPQYVLMAGAGGWLLLQMVDQLVQQEVLHDLAYPLTLNLVVAGLAGVGVVSWFHGEAGAQKPRALEFWLLAGLGAIWVAINAVILL